MVILELLRSALNADGCFNLFDLWQIIKVAMKIPNFVLVIQGNRKSFCNGKKNQLSAMVLVRFLRTQ